MPRTRWRCAGHTRAALVDFLDYASDKGLMEANTAASQKTAVQKVLGMDGDLAQINVAGFSFAPGTAGSGKPT